MYFKIKKFVKLRAKNTLIFKLRVCINVFVNFSFITSRKYFKKYVLSLELQQISLMNFYSFYSGMNTKVNLFYFSDES
jgi:hypothetical protein